MRQEKINLYLQSIVVLILAVYNKPESVLKVLFDFGNLILSVNFPNHITFNKELKSLIEKLDKKKVDDLDVYLSEISDLLSAKVLKKIDYVSFKKKSVWQETVGPFLWKWIHCTAPFIDLNHGINQKKDFILFIQVLIGCSICLSNYKKKIPFMISSLDENSLENIFLCLHSKIKENNHFAEFICDKNLINFNFKHKYNIDHL